MIAASCSALPTVIFTASSRLSPVVSGSSVSLLRARSLSMRVGGGLVFAVFSWACAWDEAWKIELRWDEISETSSQFERTSRHVFMATVAALHPAASVIGSNQGYSGGSGQVISLEELGIRSTLDHCWMQVDHEEVFCTQQTQLPYREAKLC